MVLGQENNGGVTAKTPRNLNLYLKDQRVMQALGVLLNVKFKGPTGDDMEIPEEESPKKSEPAKEEKKPEPEPMKKSILNNRW